MWSKTDIATTVLGSIANLLLVTALGLGFYMRWLYTGDSAIVYIAFTGLFVFSISLALIYYFSLDEFGCSLSRLYIGCMLGVVSFTEHTTFHEEARENAVNLLLMTSLVIRCSNKLFIRIAYPPPKHIVLIDSLDSLEMLGVTIAAMATGKDFVSIALLIMALSWTITTIRLKSFLGVLNLFFIIVISRYFYFPKLLELPANPFSLACFVGRIAFEPVVDLYFCTVATLDRWQPILSLSSFKQKLMILGIFAIQVSFYSIIAMRMHLHKEWFIVVPMFAAFSVIWITIHLVFLVTCWLLSNKISHCHATFNSLSAESRNLEQIMASKGVRHFSLISQRLTLITVASTVVMGLLGWTTNTALSLSFFCMVVPVESAVMSLLGELGSVLGGTCIGFGLVAPSLTVR